MLARIVTFDGVSQQRMAEMRDRIGSQEQPEDIPATEMMLLHDADSETAMAILFFENEEDYARGDAALSAMPADETPGTRTSVRKYDVGLRMESNRA